MWHQILAIVGLISDLMRGQTERTIRLENRIERVVKQMSDIQTTIGNLRDEVNQAKADFDAFKGNVATKVADLQKQIADLQASAGQAVDLSGLQASVDELKGDIDAATV